MSINSLEIKDKTKYDLDNIGYIDDFDVNSLKITKKESQICANIYYTRCALNLDDDIIIPLHFLINRLIGFIEEIDGSNDKYLVAVSSLRNKKIMLLICYGHLLKMKLILVLQEKIMINLDLILI